MDFYERRKSVYDLLRDFGSRIFLNEQLDKRKRMFVPLMRLGKFDEGSLTEDVFRSGYFRLQRIPSFVSSIRIPCAKS